MIELKSNVIFFKLSFGDRKPQDGSLGCDDPKAWPDPQRAPRTLLNAINGYFRDHSDILSEHNPNFFHSVIG